MWTKVQDARGPGTRGSVDRISFPDFEQRAEGGLEGRTSTPTWAEAPRWVEWSFARKELSLLWLEEERGTRWSWRGSYPRDPGLYPKSLGKILKGCRVAQDQTCDFKGFYQLKCLQQLKRCPEQMRGSQLGGCCSGPGVQVRWKHGLVGGSRERDWVRCEHQKTCSVNG